MINKEISLIGSCPDLKAESNLSIIALPITTPSVEVDAITPALSGLEIPKPTSTGKVVIFWMTSNLLVTSVMSIFPAPVTPLNET